jgi:hypothetical protein
MRDIGKMIFSTGTELKHGQTDPDMTVIIRRAKSTAEVLMYGAMALNM